MKNLVTLLSTFAFVIIFFSCKLDSSTGIDTPKKKPKIGTADTQSALIADKMMKAMGGQQKWDDLNFVSWKFFGVRSLIWDKKGNRVRIENPKDTSIYLLDMNSGNGRYSKGGIEELDSTRLAQKLVTAKNIWINDSYWLVMPFKLRDEGVNLRYIRLDTIPGGQSADVLELTFSEVGNTPENKYEVYVDQSDNLIKQWDYYKSALQDEPSRSWPWDNYKDFNGILLSSERSDKSGPSEVKIFDTLEDAIFQQF